MAKKFYVWKDRNCNGVKPEWLFLTGEQFYEFIRREENKGRHFIKMPPLEEGEDEYIIEATEEKFKEWETERLHHRYLMKQIKEAKTDSLDILTEDELESAYEYTFGRYSLDEQIESALMKAKLHEALKTLNPTELKIVELYYFKEGMTQSDIAMRIGYSQATVHNKKKRILKKIEEFLNKN